MTPTELKNYALRRNGHPIVKVDVTDEQLDDAIELAVQLLRVRDLEDPYVKMLTSALVRQQWSFNMMKFNNVQLPGGMSINVQGLYETATKEIVQIIKLYANKQN